MRHSILGATAVAIALLATGCGDDDDGAGGVTVRGVDFAYEPQTATAAAGTVELRFENRGAQVHNLAFEDSTGLTAAGLEDFIGAGESVDYTIDAGPGSYGFFCSVPGHRELGMVGTLVVE